jgi:predicted flap endonuclease-1-like 5' DNA nuclease
VIITVIFLLLCVFFTKWYLCSVRHLCEMSAVLEIFAMILLAFLVGFAGSWLLSENTFLFLRTQLGKMQEERSGMQDQLQLLEKQNQSARQHIAQWQQEVSLLAQVKKVTEPLLTEAKRQVTNLEQELAHHQQRYDNLKAESDSIRDLAAQLRDQLNAERVKEAKPSEEKAVIDPVEKEKRVADKVRSRFTPSTWQTKNDLTLISGIGPAIQKKLNKIGIYSFQQISELTPEMIDQITKAIRFFPDRIGRDNWIGQAAALVKVKDPRKVRPLRKS